MTHCTRCGDMINDTIVTFEKKPYHLPCLACHQCRSPLSGKSIYKHEDHHYDAECYATFHAKKCAVCLEPLIDPNVKYTSYDGKTYHPNCFLCNRCENSLSGKKFYLDGDNKVCEQCM